MTTIGSTNPYYASIYTIPGKNGGDKNGTSAGGDYAAPRHSQSGGMTGSDTVFSAKLAGALWSMESQGVAIDQNAGDTSLGEAPSTKYEEEFMELAKKSFAERIREQYLDEHNLTEDELKTMSPEDREAVEAEIRKAILEAMGVGGKTQDTAMEMGGGQAVPSTGEAVKPGDKDATLLSA